MAASVDDIAKILDSIAKLVSVLAWPALVCFVLFRYGNAMGEFFASLSEFTIKAAGGELTAKRQKVEAAAALAAADASRSGMTGDADRASNPREAVEVVADSVTPRVLRKTKGAVVLWVDDRPENNKYERQSLEVLGIRLLLATSTEEALAMLRNHRVDAIISDMGRPPDPRAGYTLLDALRASGDQTPYIIYAGSSAPEHKAEAISHGAIGTTNRAPKLFEYVLRALR
jgi:CheY-like chemotaxis protein